MPFNLLSDQVYASLIRPVLEAAGYEVTRADDSLHQRAIMQSVVQGIQAADLIVADLTGRNANVFYELGIAHALGKPVVMIAQSTQDIPFDVTAYPVHIYPLELQKPARLRDTLTSKLRPVLDGARAGQVIFTNPFTDFGSLIQPATEESPDSDGLLEMLAAGLRDFPNYTALLNEATEIITELGARQAVITESAGSPEEGREIENALSMAANSAALWDEFATRFEAIVERAIPLTTSIERGTVASIRLGGFGGNDEAVADLKQSVRTMGVSAVSSAGMLVNFAGIVRDLSQLSGSLRGPGGRLASVMESLAAQMGRIGALPELLARD